MSVILKWDGLDAFKAELNALPTSLTEEAKPIVQGAATNAASDIRKGYASHVVSGRLAGSVVVTQFDRGKLVAGWVVKSLAKIAHIFENGTQARHNALGANRGAMPPGHVFIPAVIQRRRAMYRQLKELLVKKGLVVEGDA